MIKAKQISDALAKYQKLMETLENETFGGFMLIIPPDGVTIEEVVMGSEPTRVNFFKRVADKCAEAQTSSGGYIGANVR